MQRNEKEFLAKQGDSDVLNASSHLTDYKTELSESEQNIEGKDYHCIQDATALGDDFFTLDDDRVGLVYNGSSLFECPSNYIDIFEIDSTSGKINLQAKLTGHTSDIIKAESVPGKLPLLVSASLDNTIRLWNYKTGRCEQIVDTVNKFGTHMRGAALTKDGIYILVHSTPRNIMATVSLLDLNDNFSSIRSFTIPALFGDSDGIFCERKYDNLLVTDNGKIITVDLDSNISVWDFQGNLQFKIDDKQYDIRTPALCMISPNQLATLEHHRTLRIWDLESKQLQKTINNENFGVFISYHQWKILSAQNGIVAVAPIGNMVNCEGKTNRDHKSIIIYDINTEEVVRTLTIPGKLMANFTLTDKGEVLAISCHIDEERGINVDGFHTWCFQQEKKDIAALEPTISTSNQSIFCPQQRSQNRGHLNHEDNDYALPALIY